MTTLIFGIGGAVIGSYFDQPGLGYSLGSALGGSLFPDSTKVPDVQGPRLGDLKVQASTYGKMIPIVFGRARLAGNVIWSTDIIETPHAQTVSSGGGKGAGGGGSEQTQTTYTYSVSCAIEICEGEIFGIRRIWANGKLIYSLDSAASVNDVLASQDQALTIYTGTETQIPDPLIESVKGAGLVPGYRGTAYAVFTSFQLADYGNRTPNFEFEVITSGSIPPLQWVGRTTPSSLIWDGLAWSPDLNLWVAVSDDTPGAVMTSPDGITWTLGTITAHRFRDVVWSDALTRFIAISLDTYAESNDGFTWQDVGTGGSFPLIPKNYHTITVTPGGEILVGGIDWFSISFTEGTSWQLIDPGNHHASNRVMWVDEIGLYISVGTNNGVGTGYSIYGSVNGLIWAGTPTYFDGTGIAKWQDIAWSPELNLLVVVGSHLDYPQVITSIDGYTWTGVTLSISPSQGWYSVVWSADYSHFVAVGYGGETMVSSDGVTWTSIAAATNLNWNTVRWSPELQMFAAISSSGSTNQVMTATLDPRITALPVDLGLDVVKPLCLLSGLDASEVNVADLVGTEVHGYIVGSRSSVRSMIEPLMQVYFFDSVESDNTLKFVARGSASIITIPEEDLAAREGGSTEMPDAVSITRKQEVDLPVGVDVQYMNMDNDYQIGQQGSRRLITSAVQMVTLQIPVVLTDDEALQVADVNMYVSWVEREKFSFSTSRKYMRYEPGDVITVTKDNVEMTVLVLTKNEGANGLLNWTACLDDSSIYSQDGVGAPSPISSVHVFYPGLTTVAFLDLPMLRGADNDPGFYFAARGTEDDWRGMELHQSKNSGTTYALPVNAGMLTASTMGVCATALGNFPTTGSPTVDPSGRNEVFDEKNTVSVVMNAELVSITRAEALADPTLNVVAIGNEVLQFLTATLTSTFTYTLSRLLRGRLGTEWAMSQHTSADTVVLLDGDIRTIAQQFSDVNRSYLYKPVSVGRTLGTTDAQSFTNTGVRRKPLAGVHLAGGYNGDGDLVLRWVPRTRSYGSWLDGVDAPIGETSEKYLVVVMNGSTELRLLQVSTPACMYTVAQQAADFGSPTPSGFTVKVYQLSSEFGRGYPLTGTF